MLEPILDDLGPDGIAARIPHSGRMCLLERVLHWDVNSIRCSAISHRNADNPLREAAGLPVWAAIEYAAQAAAVHCALLSVQAAPQSGVLAALRNVETRVQWLDPIAAELIIHATLMHSDAAGGIYRFQASAEGSELISGQFTLMFRHTKAGDGA